ncbi:MAG: hypothetical protein ACOCT9_00035 [archaeon]
MSDCSLEKASEQFQELIENQKTGLEYMQQLNATYNAAQNNMWNKATALITDIVDDALGDTIDDILGDDLNFDTLKSAIQMVALTSPEAFGELLKKEIKKIKEFFENQLDIIKMLIEYVQESIDNFEDEWSTLDSTDLVETQLLELNKFMNSTLPEAGEKINESKRELMIIETDLYNFNTTQNKTQEKVLNIINDLKNTKDILEEDSEESIIESLIDLRLKWDDITKNFQNLVNPSSEEFIDLRSMFEEVGENFKNSIENLLAILETIRGALMDLDTLDQNMFDEWSNTINHLIANIDEKEDYEVAPKIRNAIDEFINSGDPQTIRTNFPLIGTIVTERTFDQWKDKSNIAKLNKTNWINSIEEIISILETIEQKTYDDVLDTYDGEFSPIAAEVINVYKKESREVWGDLIRKVNEINHIIDSISEGVEISKSIKEAFIELDSILNSLETLVTDGINYFDDNSPIDNLVSDMGLTSSTKGVIDGITVMADYLGLDHMSDLIQKGDFGSLLDIEQEDADSIQQLLNDLECLKEATDQTKSLGIEIRKFVLNEKERKERLRNNVSKIMEQGVENKEEEIQRLQSLNDRFKNNL